MSGKKAGAGWEANHFYKDATTDFLRLKVKKRNNGMKLQTDEEKCVKSVFNVLVFP